MHHTSSSTALESSGFELEIRIWGWGDEWVTAGGGFPAVNIFLVCLLFSLPTFMGLKNRVQVWAGRIMDICCQMSAHLKNARFVSSCSHSAVWKIVKTLLTLLFPPLRKRIQVWEFQSNSFVFGENYAKICFLVLSSFVRCYTVLRSVTKSYTVLRSVT